MLLVRWISAGWSCEEQDWMILMGPFHLEVSNDSVSILAAPSQSCLLAGPCLRKPV